MSESSTIYVGLDQHEESIAGAYLGADRSLAPTCLEPIGTRTGDVDAMVRTLQSKGKKLVFADEAGPCGYGLYRHPMRKGHPDLREMRMTHVSQSEGGPSPSATLC